MRQSSRAALVLGACALAACGAPEGESQAEAETAPATETGMAEAPEAEAVDPALAERLAILEARAERVQDVADIKLLQRTYGYYVSEGLWTDAAALFTPDAELEYGLDGVYRGRERILDYFFAMGGGEEGLGEGELNEHFQLMPVVTLAPDSQTAEARWRDLSLTGTLGGEAYWGEGPHQVSYVEDADGVWRIERLHWFDSVIVPYETGWLETADPTGGRFVTDLEPDAPPTVEYETWPGVYLPPFHFREGADGETQVSPFTGDAVVEEASDGDPARRAAVLAQQVELMEAENALENLQRIFGFYIDKNLWSEAAALFAADGTLEWGGSGVYRGPESIKAYLSTIAPEGPQEGVLNDHMQLMPVVHVSPDGRSARGRFQGFNQTARHGEYGRWGSGVYETEFANEGGVWTIAAMRYFPTMETPYEDGWGVTALPLAEPLEDPAPDGAATWQASIYPAPFVAPFHYGNPAGGTPAYDGDPADFAAPADAATLEAQLESLERRIGLLEDREAAENLNAIYGYYLAHNQWDSLAGIFTGDGIIEIAMRGQYVGRDAVRRNLNLYGEQGGEQHGLLHNHMQYQPVIHIAPDGETAKMRSRAFSIMGQYGAYAQWAGGTYENDFAKVDGKWLISRDQVFNTYFTPYDLSWENLNRREPPGLSDDNPPDLPPSMDFEMYPSAFLPPFHYPNPVTGAAPATP